MKKYLVFLLLIVFIVLDIFVSNTIMVKNQAKNSFKNSGYVLKYTNTPERFYFNAESKYQKSYNDQIVFKNTEGEKVVVDQNNFMHYEDNSISAFSKGVLIDLDMIDTEPIIYYNISANKVLRKISNDKYAVNNLKDEIIFENLLWKISDTKYLLASNDLKIVFSDGTSEEINGYSEIEYIDNEIVRIYNHEKSYETISSSVYLSANGNIKVNLGDKIVSKEEKNRMTLENMVIDSNDNVTIIDIEEDENEKNNEEKKNEGNNNNNGGIAQGGSAIANTGDTIANGGTAVIGGGEIPAENNETEIEEDLTVNAPKYIVKDFEVTPIGMKAIVNVEDNEARLLTGTTTYIMKNSTGETVYSMPETGQTEIKIDTDLLTPNTEYTLVMEATYGIEEMEYKKNFIYKVFRTKGFGLSLEKDIFTTESLSFYVVFDKNSNVSKLDVELVEGEQERKNIQNTGNKERIEFAQLLPDTEYTLKIKNIFIDNVSNDSTYQYTFKTLKERPKLSNGNTHSNIDVEINKRDSKFVLTIPGLTDGIVDTLNYKIYTETEGKEDQVYSRLLSSNNLTLPINEIIQRNKEYYCKVYATYYDNEKIVEYEIANTDVSFNMNSSEMPTARFEKLDENSITFNSIKGKIVIEDPGNTINSKDGKVEISYTSTTTGIDDTGTISLNGIGEELEIPIELEKLKANETYKFSIYATYDLHDDNGERYGHIGTVMITTKRITPLKANWDVKTTGIDVNLKLESSENSLAELDTLYSFDLALYKGKYGASNTAVKTLEIKDEGIDQFEASLKKIYSEGDGKLLTKDVFGLSETQRQELDKETYCTIAIKNAKDYVSYKKTKRFENEITIDSNYVEILINKDDIQNPLSSEDAMNIIPVTKDRLAGIKYSNLKVGNEKEGNFTDYNSIEEILDNNQINNNTVTAIKVSANLSNAILNTFKGQYFKYYVYNKNNELVAYSDFIENTGNSSEAPSALFLLSNGTSTDGQDSDRLARGNQYYFKYYIYTNNQLENNPQYPLYVEGKEFWDIEVKGKPALTIEKQEANIIMYPSINDNDSMSFKYKLFDIDKTIKIEEDGKKYFQSYYAGVLLSDNLKEIVEGENQTENYNGYYIAKFDKLSEKTEGYDLDIKLKTSLKKDDEYKAREIIMRQKYKKVLGNPEINIQKVDRAGMELTIKLSSISDTDRNNIVKVIVELENLENANDKIIIERSVDKVTNDNNDIFVYIRYLDLISENGIGITSKRYKVKAKICYINGEIGYDIIKNTDFVTYKGAYWAHRANSEAILEYKNIKFDQGNIVDIKDEELPRIYSSNRYDFENEKVSIKQNDNEIAWLNYSKNGLTRTIGDLGQIAILPQRIEQYDNDLNLQIALNNIKPGVRNSEIKTVTQPAEVTINLKNVYTNGTIASEKGLSDVHVELYDKNKNIVADEKLDENGTVTINELNQGETYYFKLYILDNEERKTYLYDMVYMEEGRSYSFVTLEKIEIKNLTAIHSSENKTYTFKLDADIKSGYTGFRYKITDVRGSNVGEIMYSLNGRDYKISNQNGEFIVGLEEFEQEGASFGNVYVSIMRGTFFEYKKTFILYAEPIVIDNQNNVKNIGDIKGVYFSYNPIVPYISIQISRGINSINNKQEIKFSISINDVDKLLRTDNGKFEIFYDLYKDGVLIDLKNKITFDENKRVFIINLNSDLVNGDFNYARSFEISLTYNCYTSNRNDEYVQKSTSKEIKEITTDVQLGKVSAEIINNSYLYMRFYNSYKLADIKKIQFCIYNMNTEMLAYDYSSNFEIMSTSSNGEEYKSISIDTGYQFERGKSYIIAISFINEEGEEIIRFEPDNSIIYN